MQGLFDRSSSLVKKTMGEGNTSTKISVENVNLWPDVLDQFYPMADGQTGITVLIPIACVPFDSRIVKSYCFAYDPNVSATACFYKPDLSAFKLTKYSSLEIMASDHAFTHTDGPILSNDLAYGFPICYAQNITWSSGQENILPVKKSSSAAAIGSVAIIKNETSLQEEYSFGDFATILFSFLFRAKYESVA